MYLCCSLHRCLVLMLWLPPYINDRVIAVNSMTSGCLWSVSRNNNNNFAIFMAVAGYHVPSFIIVYCYFRVFFKMRRSQQCLDKQRQLIANNTDSGRQAVMRSTLTVSSFRSTDSDTGSNVRESEPTRARVGQTAPDSNSPTMNVEANSKLCSVKIIITSSADADTDVGDCARKTKSAAERTTGEEFVEVARNSLKGNRSLLRLPYNLEREEMTKSNPSLDLHSPVYAVKKLGSRRPCSFTEGTNPNRTFSKHSPDGDRYRQRNMSGSVRLWRSKHSSALSQMTRSSHETVKSPRKNREYKLFIRVTYIVVAYIICWTPFHVVFDCQLAGIEVDPNLYTLAVLMCYLNSTLNPILYALGNPKLKAAFMDTLACVKCKKTLSARSNEPH